jgi:peptidoglycan/LPS O-acetylase OafA/YrhL
MFWSIFRKDPVDPDVMNFFVGSGNSMVTLFFVVSGFVLTLLLDGMKAAGRPGIAVQFLISRIFRIYPAVIVIVLGFALLEPDFILNGAPERSWDSTMQDALLIRSTMVWPTWSARVEVAGTPILLIAWLLRERFGWRAPLLLGGVLLAVSFPHELYADDEIGQHLYLLIIGMLVADSRALFDRLPRLLAVPLVLAIFPVCAWARPNLGWHSSWAIAIEAACCFVLAGALAYGSVPTRWLEHPSLRFFGRISYSFYLVHFVVLFVLLRCLPDSIMAAISFGDARLIAPEVCVLVATLSSALSWALYGLVEHPSIRIGRRIGMPCGAAWLALRASATRRFADAQST